MNLAIVNIVLDTLILMCYSFIGIMLWKVVKLKRRKNELLEAFIDDHAQEVAFFGKLAVKVDKEMAEKKEP